MDTSTCDRPSCKQLPTWRPVANEFTYRITTTRFDEDYTPSTSSRATTNFANLARGEHRQRNLRTALAMIERRFNDLAGGGDRYAVELEIVSVDLELTAAQDDRAFPLLEVLDVQIVDRATGRRSRGIVGNNFSSYVRDYDFTVLLPAAGGHGAGPTVPDDFGDLHGKLFDHFLESAAYRDRFPLPPVVCISVSTSRSYRRTEHRHAVLGVEYQQDDRSLTDEYFGRMGLQVRFFMPPGGVAPLAFYFRGDLLDDYSDLQLMGTVSTMETFQRIYRPEIYNADSPAGPVYQPSLTHSEFTRTPVDYDRVERGRLAIVQGRFAEEHLMKTHGAALRQWAAARPSPAR